MEILLGSILAIQLIVLVRSFFASNQSTSHSNDFLVFKDQLKEDFDQRFNRFDDKLEMKLFQMEHKFENKLDQNDKKASQTFEQLIERLARIDEAQKQIEKLGENVFSLNEILVNNKTRGTLGEVQLYQIVHSIFGDNERLYKKQYKLSKGQIVDLALFLPEPTGLLCIDSKFPLDNFKKIQDQSLSAEEREWAKKLFKKDIKKHIDDIKNKYIIAGETSEQAMMFIPAESVFAYIHSDLQDIVNYSYENKVWLASPTTLMAILTTAQVVINNIERSKHAHLIQKELMRLAQDFKRYRTRWSKLSGHLENVNKDIKDIHITSDKIADKFDQINKVNVSNFEHKKIEKIL